MADTIKEFLVSLGYAVDEKSASDWNRSLAGVAKIVLGLGAALAAAEAAIVKMVSSVTVSLDQANFNAMRAGTSVANLQAMSYALEQTGRSSASAGAMVDGLAARLRNFPSTEGFINSLGVKTREGSALRDTMDIIIDVVDATKGQSYVIGAHNAALAGISEGDYDHLRRNIDKIRTVKAERDAAARAMGVDPNKGGIQSTALMQSYRQSMMQIGLMVDALVMAVAPILGPVIDDLNKWLEANKDAIVRFAAAVVDIAMQLAAALAELVGALQPVAMWFGSIIETATGANGLVVALEAFTAIYLTSFALRMLRVTGKVRAAFLALAAAFVIGKYIAPDFGDMGLAEAPSGPDERPQQGFFGRTIDRVRSAFGMGPSRSSGAGQSGAGRSAGASRSASGAPLDRTSFAEELKDPKVRERLLALTESEVGSQGVDAQQAFMESTFNRAKARGRSLWDTMHGSYFPAITHSRTAAMAGSPRLETKYKEMFDRVYGGSNISDYATGNASGSVGFGRNGYGTFNAGGEKFGVEGADVGWAARARRDAEERAAARKAMIERLSKMKPLSLEERDERALKTTTPWGSPLDKVSGSPLVTGANDDFGVTTNRTTKIVVHGDTDPHKTADEVSRHQSRINTDMITSTERAFA